MRNVRRGVLQPLLIPPPPFLIASYCYVTSAGSRHADRCRRCELPAPL